MTWLLQWAPGGKGAHTILERFVQNGLRQFNAHRAKTDRESTSSLSPHVHFGEISTRHIFYMVRMQCPLNRIVLSGLHCCCEWVLHARVAEPVLEHISLGAMMLGIRSAALVHNLSQGHIT